MAVGDTNIRPRQPSLYLLMKTSPATTRTARNFLARHSSILLVLPEWISDIVALFAAIFMGNRLFLFFQPESTGWESPLRIALASSLFGSFMFIQAGLYRPQVSLMNLIEIRKIIRAMFLLSFLLVFSSHFLGEQHPPLLYACTLATTLLFTLSERMFFFKLQQSLHVRGVHVRRVLIVGAGEEGRLLCRSIQHSPKLGYRVLGFLDQDQRNLGISRDWFSQESPVPLVFSHDSSSLPQLVKEMGIDAIFVSNPLYSDESSDLISLATFCRENGVELHFIPVLQGFYAAQIQLNDISGIPMISFRPVRVSSAEQFSKRLFDLALVLMALPLLLPLFLLIAFCIRRDSPGPVFFKQERVGKDGVLFPMFKFRSMFVDVPLYGKSPSSSEDPRITKVGRWLRKTSLDELPQLINVLRGEMSLVGPRPEMPFIVENEYNDLYRERLRVKPGITGIWQISADRTREIHENISYDIFYIENRSLLLDIIILIRTLIFGILAMRTA